MYTYSSSATSDIPNAATITIPACDAIGAITADISLDNVTPPETYVVFVTDLSPSMDWEVANSSAPDAGESSRLALAQAAMETALVTCTTTLVVACRLAQLGSRKCQKTSATLPERAAHLRLVLPTTRVTPVQRSTNSLRSPARRANRPCLRKSQGTLRTMVKTVRRPQKQLVVAKDYIGHRGGVERV